MGGWTGADVIKAARTPKAAAAAPAKALPQRQRKKPAAKATAAQATPAKGKGKATPQKATPAKGKGKATPQKKTPVKKQNLAKAVTAKASATRQVSESVGVARWAFVSTASYVKEMRDRVVATGISSAVRTQWFGLSANEATRLCGCFASDEKRICHVSPTTSRQQQSIFVFVSRVRVRGCWMYENAEQAGGEARRGSAGARGDGDQRQEHRAAAGDGAGAAGGGHAAAQRLQGQQGTAQAQGGTHLARPRRPWGPRRQGCARGARGAPWAAAAAARGSAGARTRRCRSQAGSRRSGELYYTRSRFFGAQPKPLFVRGGVEVSRHNFELFHLNSICPPTHLCLHGDALALRRCESRIGWGR